MSIMEDIDEPSPESVNTPRGSTQTELSSEMTESLHSIEQCIDDNSQHSFQESSSPVEGVSSRPVTKEPPTSTTEAEPSASAIEGDPLRSVSEKEMSTTEAEPSSVSEEGPSSSVPEEGSSTSVTKGELTSSVAKEEMSTSLTEAEPSTSEGGQSRSVPEGPSTSVTKGEPTSSVVKEEISSSVAESEPSISVTDSKEDPLQASIDTLPINDNLLTDNSLEEDHSVQEIPRSDLPVLDDRNLEQFSEVLLDSDSSGASNSDAVTGGTGDRQSVKRVRFADDLVTDQGSQLGRSSPPPTSLPLSPKAMHPGVPVSPSPTSARQPVSQQHSIDELIAGVEYPAKYLGSTPILLSGMGAIKSARMHQAQQAVKLIKDPDNESRPQFEIGIKISTQSVKIVDVKADVVLMEHPLHTISYVADIEGVLVIMAHIGPAIDPDSSASTPEGVGVSVGSYTPKITCHVLDADDARLVARVIGQAFTAAYKQFLKSSGVSEEALEEAEYAHILNAQSVPQLEVETLSDRSKLKKITMAKSKGEYLGVMVMEAGYGSAIPACVVVHLSKTGAALKSGLLNVGDHVISVNGVSLVGMSKKCCIEQIKKCRPLNVVKMVVCSVPAVVDVTIVRPDLKYQLGFSVHEGMICSLIRGSIGERSGVRIGHRIIDINGTSTVNMSHQDIVHLLSCTVGDLQIRTMPNLMYKLLTGQVLPEYC